MCIHIFISFLLIPAYIYINMNNNNNNFNSKRK